MSEALTQTKEAFRKLVKKIHSYHETLGVLYWDLRTGAPKKGVEARSEAIGELSAEMFKLTVSDEMKGCLEVLLAPANLGSLSRVERKMAEECKEEYDRSQKIPPDLYQAYVVLASQAESIWEEAKENNDFAMFQPYLEKIVAMKQQFIELWGYQDHKYNTLLDMYEPGMTVAKLDELFGQLRDRLVPLVEAIARSESKPETKFLKQTFDVAKQKQYSLYMLGQLGYDFDAGRLDESVHPFATGLNPGDVRITTRYLEHDVVSALFGTIHECGHALYEQNVSEELIGTNLCEGTSMGIHESQSRLWENMIGRSKPFWSRYYSELQKLYPLQLGGVSADDFYRGINVAEPSLIRIEADEVTYNLHIIIRYELEKALFNGDLQVADLPAAWNAKYEEYLGIVPETDADGVLQDVHWSGGDFGYFPSYALGNMYGAQMIKRLRSELPEFDSLIAAGNLAPIRSWLIEKVYRHGKLLTPGEIIVQVTGEELNPVYLAEYLEEKYKDIYRL
ncbi:carboxypeptidase M32 [Paenibacillus sp. y28]|uniref:carboxypeptidase M32 n=1 Tax=Paenibacillus sp. y28 TaxID=3129110 RepID=UPI00301994D6